MTTTTTSVKQLINKRDDLLHQLDEVERELLERKADILALLTKTKDTMYYVLKPSTSCRHGNKEELAVCNFCSIEKLVTVLQSICDGISSSAKIHFRSSDRRLISITDTKDAISDIIMAVGQTKAAQNGYVVRYAPPRDPEHLKVVHIIASSTTGKKDYELENGFTAFHKGFFSDKDKYSLTYMPARDDMGHLVSLNCDITFETAEQAFKCEQTFIHTKATYAAFKFVVVPRFNW